MAKSGSSKDTSFAIPNAFGLPNVFGQGGMPMQFPGMPNVDLSHYMAANPDAFVQNMLALMQESGKVMATLMERGDFMRQADGACEGGMGAGACCGLQYRFDLVIGNRRDDGRYRHENRHARDGELADGIDTACRGRGARLDAAVDSAVETCH